MSEDLSVMKSGKLILGGASLDQLMDDTLLSSSDLCGFADYTFDFANEDELTLHTAATEGNEASMKLLLDDGVIVDVMDEDEATALILAAGMGHSACVKLLLMRKANVNLSTINKITPLHAAASNGHAECVRLLLVNAANVDFANEDSSTPLHAAASEGHASCVKLLLDNKADVDLVDKDGLTPLQTSASEGHEKCVELLLVGGANANLANKNNGFSPLHAAAAKGHLTCVKLLIDHSAILDCADSDLATPLSRAADNGHWECVKLLLERGAKVDHVDKDGSSSLCLSAFKGFAVCVKMLINHGASVNLANVAGSALHAAAANGHLACVKLLVESGAILDLSDNGGSTPLSLSVLLGHTHCVQYLLESQINVNLAVENGSTSLILAAMSCHFDCTKLLLGSHADVNSVDEEGKSPLFWAVTHHQVSWVKLFLDSCKEKHLANMGWTPVSSNLDCVKLLLEWGANVDLPNKDGITPLHAAAVEGHVECVKLLVKNDANVDLANKDGITPLRAAAAEGHVECVKLLVENGANVDLANKDGITPLHAAAVGGHMECVKVLVKNVANVDLANKDGITPLHAAAVGGHMECVKLLVENGANVDLANKDGITPVRAAVVGGHMECVNLLVKNGANVDLANKDGITPLHSFAADGEAECVKLLVENGANVDLANKDGITPLRAAVVGGHMECVKVLVKNGANVDLPNKDGITPLHAAAAEGHMECVKLLVENGANVDLANKDGTTPLSVAFDNGHMSCVYPILAGGASAGILRMNNSLLHKTASRSHVDCLKYLLVSAREDVSFKFHSFDDKWHMNEVLPTKEKLFPLQNLMLFELGARLDRAIKDGITLLSTSASKNHVACVKLLIENGASVNLANEDGTTPLSVAFDNGHMACVKLLVAEGANDGGILLHKAAFRGHIDWVELLIDGGSSVNFANEHKSTPLHAATWEGHTACVKLLLAHKADLDLVDKYDSTLLFITAVKGHADCMKLLLESGANVDVVNKDNETVLHTASSKGVVDCVKLLLDGGASVNHTNKDGVSPLSKAVLNNHLSCVKLLLERGANVDLVDKYGKTPVAIAISKNIVDCVVALIAYGAKVHYRPSLFGSNPYACCDSEGKTALHIAIERNRAIENVMSIVQFYPQAVDVKDKNGKTPLDIALQRGADLSVLWILLQYQKDVKVTDAISLLQPATRLTNRSIHLVHIHLVGHGYAGKTTCYRALKQALKYANPIMFGLFGNHNNVFVDRSDASNKTLGMEMNEVDSSSYHKWLIRDYGGQDDFHVNHARFLSIPGSIYVVVVALWDAEKKNRFEISEVVNRFLYWLKFLNSIVSVDLQAQCLVLINFVHYVTNQHATDCMEAIKICTVNWNSDNPAVKIFGDPCIISVSNVADVRNLNATLQAMCNSQQSSVFPVLSYVNAIDDSFAVNVRKIDSKLKNRSDFIKTVCIPAAMKLVRVDTLPVDAKQVNFVCEKMMEYLCASGKIIVIPTPTSSGDPLIVLDVNWLSKEILGSLINNLAQPGRNEFVLTASDINRFTNNGSYYFGGVDALVSFLESIGACISVTVGEFSKSEIQRWFPLCAQRKFDAKTECLAMEKGTWNKFRKIVRLFKLSDPTHQMFPPGFFIDLFLKILSSFSLKCAKVVKVFSNGMNVMYEAKNSRLQVLLIVLDDNCSFTVEVSRASRIATSTSSNECWKRFIQVCEVIINPKVVYARNDIIRVSPWFDNVKLMELFVDPTSDASSIAKTAKSNTVEVIEVRDTKTLDDLLMDRDVALQNLYIYGCDESDLSVDEKDRPQHILEVIRENVEMLQQLTERWTTMTVVVFSDMLQESFNEIISSLKNSVGTEFLALVESNRQTVCKDSAEQLLCVVDKLRSDIGEIAENSQVLTEIERLHVSMKDLTLEVKKMQNVNDTLQSTILQAFDDRKILYRINNMMETVVKGTSDVPTMAIVVPLVKKASLLTSFNPSDWTTNEYSLYFVCSHSHQVVSCGPDGKGYRFRRAKEWFKKVAPVIKVCLVAAKIALAISGIPIPISGAVESLDQITVVNETKKYLDTALSVLHAASDASGSSNAVGDAGVVVDDYSVVDAEQYVKALDDMLKKSDTIEAYKSLKALLDEVDSTLGSVGVEKMTSESGKTGWVKKGDDEVKASFLVDEKWPMTINGLKKSYKEVVSAAKDQSTLGSKIGLWLPMNIFGKTNRAHMKK